MAVIFHNRDTLRITTHSAKRKAEKICNANSFLEKRNKVHYNEDYLERVFLECMRLKYDDLVYIIPFKKILLGMNGVSKAPDAMMISKDLLEWSIVEVETIGDDFKHLKSQLEVFTNLDKSSIIHHIEDIYDRIKSIYKLSEIKREELQKLILSKKNKTFLVSDHIKSKWRYDLESNAIRCKFVTFQEYYDQHGHQYFRVNGDINFISTLKSVECEFDGIRNVLLVNGSKLFFESDEENTEIEIEYDGLVHRWQHALWRNKAQLMFNKLASPLKTGHKNYILERKANKKLVLFDI